MLWAHHMNPRRCNHVPLATVINVHMRTTRRGDRAQANTELQTEQGQAHSCLNDVLEDHFTGPPFPRLRCMDNEVATTDGATTAPRHFNSVASNGCATPAAMSKDKRWLCKVRKTISRALHVERIVSCVDAALTLLTHLHVLRNVARLSRLPNAGPTFRPHARVATHAACYPTMVDVVVLKVWTE